MRIPEKIKIDTVFYDVIVTDHTIIVEGKECKGSIDYNKNVISLASFIGASQTKVTLMHEITHGMAFERGIAFDGTGVETVVDELGKAMMQVIRDNKELIEYITE